ncbi:MAG: hypothetical protein JW955_10780 [Sedimentisphaerales bacterium]|nr:hypothetical protein [Sedimentisphaerales bacterium]
MRFRIVGLLAACAALVVLSGVAGAAVRLEWRLAKGKTYYQRAVMDQQITQTVMEQEQKMEQAFGIGQKLQVLDVDAQGNMRIQHTYLWTRVKQDNPLVQVDYDSSKSSPVPAGAEGFAALVGQSYTVMLTPQGKVLDVNGVEQVSEAVLKRLPGGAGALAMNPVAMYIDKERVKQMTESNMAIYPDKPVSAGDSWSREMAVMTGWRMIVQSKWTLQKEEADVATIGVASTLRCDPNGPPMEAGGLTLKADLAGTQEGTVQVAEATGLVTGSKQRQQLKGEIKAITTPDQPPMMVMPMTVNSEITGEMSEQMWKTGQP